MKEKQDIIKKAEKLYNNYYEIRKQYIKDMKEIFKSGSRIKFKKEELCDGYWCIVEYTGEIKAVNDFKKFNFNLVIKIDNKEYKNYYNYDRISINPKNIDNIEFID